MTMLARGPGGTGAALPTGATTGQVLQWNGSAWVAATPSATGTTPNATAAAPGLVQLAGDLAGTASAPTVPALTGKADKTALAPVATSGAYGDLTGRPALAPVASSGAYGDLTGRPALAPVASSGAYGDLTGRPALAPVATSGAYGDLTGAPTVPTLYLRAKTTATTTTSSSVVADPDLQVPSLPVGTYAFELFFTPDTGNAATTNVFVGGSATYTGGMVFSSTGTAGINQPLPIAGFGVSNPNRMTAQGWVKVTVAGTFTISLSSGAPGNQAGAGAGSWLRLTKVA